MTLFGFKFTRMRVLIIAFIVLIAMTVPSIRYVIWWLLPLGSGNDDIIGGAALVVIAILVFVEVWTKRYPNNPYNQRGER